MAVTNAAGTTNGQTITVNGNVRTWTNTVQVALNQVLTNSTAAGAKSNLYTQIALNPFLQVNQLDAGSTNFDLVGSSGLAMAVTLSAGWGTVTYSTQVVSSVYDVRVPMASEPTAGQQANISSLVLKGINDLATNSFFENATAVANLMGLTNNQTVAGAKLLTNAAGQFSGNVSNATSIGGTVYQLTNGVWYSAGLSSPATTNLVNHGNAVSSPGAAGGSEQIGSGALANGASSLAVGQSSIADGANSAAIGASATASNQNSTAVGNFAAAWGLNSTAVGLSAKATNTSSTAIGHGALATFGGDTAIGKGATTTATNQTRIGTAGNWVSIPGGAQIEGNVTNLHAMGTNTFAVGADISFGRYALTSLANGNNAAIVAGTNIFIQVSGPTGAFTINGIAGGRDGKFLIILNRTGQNMTIAHDSGVDPTAANRIYTMTGADRATTGDGAALLIYSAADSRWILLNLDL